MTQPRAIVRFVDDQLVLDDPDALEFVRVVSKHNCELIFKAQKDRVDYFKQRIVDREDDPSVVMLVIINVDDCALSRELADAFMPGYDWQAIRDTGVTPYARGLVMREGIQYVLEKIDSTTATKLSAIEGIACAVFDHKTVEVFRV